MLGEAVRNAIEPHREPVPPLDFPIHKPINSFYLEFYVFCD